MNTPLYIDDRATLDGYCRALRSSPRFAMDTEFERRSTWRARLLLVQIYDGENTALIDAPAVKDLSPLRELFAGYRGACLMHAPGQDCEVLKHACGGAPGRIHDTQLAAAFLGFDMQASYVSLAHDTLALELSKSEQTSDWARRPLTDRQIRYAANDVLYLPPIWDKLEQRLESSGRRSWYDEEVAALRRREEEKERDRPVDAREAMLEWREREAERRNIPANWVLHKRQVEELMRVEPTWENVAVALDKRKVRLSAGEVYEALTNCLRDFPEPERRARVSDALLKRAMAVIAEIAQRNNLAPALLMRRKQLLELMREPEPRVSGWRAELLMPALSKVWRE